MITVENWAEIRRLHLSEGMPIKAIARRLGVARNTVRSALAAAEPPMYSRPAKGSVLDGLEPRIVALLTEFPDMPATVIAERLGYEGASSVLRARVALLRPRFRPTDPADRTTYAAGEIVQCDLWFPPAIVPVGPGQLLAPPILTMVSAFSRWIMATALPSRTTGDLIAGMWVLLRLLGGIPKTLVWDNEAGIGQHQRLTVGARSFAGTLGTRIWQAPARDPETKGVVERANGYLQTSFMPGRAFTDPADFNTQLAAWLPRANTRLVRATGSSPAALLAADRSAMGALPPVAPRVGWSGQVRLGRDYYVRACGNDYSVCPSVIGRMVDITCDLERVQVRCAGQLVADHARSWARTLTVTDTAHVLTAKGLRREFNERTRTTGAPTAPLRAGEVVARRALSDYDTVFGLQPASPDHHGTGRHLSLVAP
ncbi:MAG: IS21 family transposase [Pseudonocardiales bacterium]|nr:IS21 family transposase [Pseudonocardiales bacterium]